MAGRHNKVRPVQVERDQERFQIRSEELERSDQETESSSPFVGAGMLVVGGGGGPPPHTLSLPPLRSLHNTSPSTRGQPLPPQHVTCFHKAHNGVGRHQTWVRIRHWAGGGNGQAGIRQVAFAWQGDIDRGMRDDRQDERRQRHDRDTNNTLTTLMDRERDREDRCRNKCHSIRSERWK